MRKTAFLLAILLIVSLLGGCADTAAPAAPPAESEAPAVVAGAKGTIGLALEKDAGLDPYACASSQNRLILSLLYEPLFSVNANFEAEPVLAENFSVAEDGKTTTVKLREDASFSDGSAVTAEDVCESLRAAAESVFYGKRLRHVTDLQARDERTVVLTTDVAYENLPLLLDIPICRREAEDEQPLGSGAYVPEGTSRLRRKKGKPCVLDEESILLIPVESAEGLLSGFRAGGISLIEADPNGDAPLLFQGTPDIWSVPTTSLQLIGFNLNSSVFSSGSVRSAVTYAIDRDAIVAEDMNGFGAATPLTMPPNCAWYAQELAASVSYDPARLRAAVQPGTEITMLVSAENPQRQTSAHRVADSLTACGFKVNLNALAPEAYATALKAGNFDLYYGQIRLSPDLDLEPLFNVNSGACFGGMETLAQLRKLCDEVRADHANSAALQSSILLDGLICPVAFIEEALYVRAEAKGDYRPGVDRPLS